MNTINSSNFPPEYQELLKHLEETHGMYLQKRGESLIADQEAKMLQALQENKKRFDRMRANAQEERGNRPQMLEQELAYINKLEKTQFELTLKVVASSSDKIKNITTRSLNNLF